MTTATSKDGVRLVVIEPESDSKCELCGKVAETRPYGPGFKRVCFECGMQDKEGTKKRMGHVLFGDSL